MPHAGGITPMAKGMRRRENSKPWLREAPTAAESVRTAVPHAGGITTMAARMHRRGNSKLWLRDTTTAAESVRTAQLHAGGETNGEANAPGAIKGIAARICMGSSKNTCDFTDGCIWDPEPVPLMLDTALVKQDCLLLGKISGGLHSCGLQLGWDGMHSNLGECHLQGKSSA